MPAPSPRPFTGIRVLDFTHVIAGPMCSFQLALLGAEVVKVEPPGLGDQLRRMGGDPARAKASMGTGFLAVNADKRSLAIDLKRAESQPILARLVAQSDVLLENFRPGVMARLGLDWERAQALNPRLVYCSLTGYGQAGPWSGWPAYDHIVQGMVGAMSTQGDEGDPPIKVGFPFCDTAAALHAAFAVSAALLERTHTGRGQRIDVAMATATLAMIATPLATYLATGEAPRRVGNVAMSGSPAGGTYETADGHIVLTANTAAQFERLCGAIGRPDLSTGFDPALWRDPAHDFSHVRRAIQDALRGRTADAWEVLLNEAGVPAGKVRSLPEIVAHPQVAGRGFVGRVPDPQAPGRTVGVHGLGFQYGGSTPVPDGTVPRLGEHSVAVLRDAGLAPEEIRRLVDEGVVGVDRP